MKKLIVLLFFTLLLVGCGSSNPFTGTWYFSYEGDTIAATFKDNGLCYAEVMDSHDKYSGKYEYDSDMIKVTSDDGLFSYEAKYLMNDDVFVVEGVKFYKNLKQYQNELQESKFVKPDNHIIPDVSGMSPEEAERILTNAGFEVKFELKDSSSVPKGKVIDTSPAAGRDRPKGTVVTIYVSGGLEEILIENYVGQNYTEIYEYLEKRGLRVLIQKKEAKDATDPNKIIDQSVQPGTSLPKGSSIILYIPDIYEEYPDFVNEGWSLDEIKEFAEKYDIELNIKYEESSEHPSGTVIKQSRTGKIVNGTTLIITVVK